MTSNRALCSQADYNGVKSYNADAMPLSSNPALLPPYLLQLMGMSRRQLEQSRTAAAAAVATPMEVDPAPAPKPASGGLKLSVAARPFVPPSPAPVQPAPALNVQADVDDGGYGYPSTSRSGGAVGGGRGNGRRSSLPPLSPRDLSSIPPSPSVASNEVPLPTVLAALTADLGPMVEGLLRGEFEELFDSVVS